MFGLFKNNKPECPIPEDIRIWMEDAFIWLINQFGEQKVISIKMLLPTSESFPINFDGSEEVAHKSLQVLAKQMEVDANAITLSFYDDKIFEIEGGMGHSLFSQQYEEEKYSSGLYSGKTQDGKFSISIERAQLKEPEKLIATIAHEISHIKILGEGRLEKNDELLTDLVTVFFGVGIFTANSSFKFYSHTDKWGYSKQGYLTQQEWGYALALFAYIRREEKNPHWIKLLSPNIKSDFIKSQTYIFNNTDKVLV